MATGHLLVTPDGRMFLFKEGLTIDSAEEIDGQDRAHWVAKLDASPSGRLADDRLAALNQALQVGNLCQIFSVTYDTNDGGIVPAAGDASLSVP